METTWTDVRAVAFDKDGTLFGFQATWGGWATDVATGLAAGDADRLAILCDAIGLDPVAQEFAPHSPVIAGTEAEVVDVLLPKLPGWTAPDLLDHLAESAMHISPSQAVPIAPLMRRLAKAGIKLGVVTNDSEAAARTQLARVGAADLFDQVLGYDSGYGAKPGPGPCTAFARLVAQPAQATIMVGDSTHDLIAGRAAGMRTVAVLTGVAGTAELSGHADVVLPDIGGLPRLLGLD